MGLLCVKLKNIVPLQGFYSAASLLFMITVDELFERIYAVITLPKDKEHLAGSMMLETLKLACTSALANNKELFGNLFAQVSYLCKLHKLPTRDAIAIQRLRAETHFNVNFTNKEKASHIRALAIFVSVVFQKAIPNNVAKGLSPAYHTTKSRAKINYRKLRAVVQSWNDTHIEVKIEGDEEQETRQVYYNEPHLIYIKELLEVRMQLNLLDCSINQGDLCPELIVLEPDFLIDISSLAACFTDMGHHPLSYIYRRMCPSVNSQAILLGHFSGMALDDVINQTNHYQWHSTLKKSFRAKAFDYCACASSNGLDNFKQDAEAQVANITEIVNELFENKETDFCKEKAIIEPSFVCEELGLQGRVDLMTTDFQLLVEQKSGKNFNIERGIKNNFGSYQREDHYVQLLLYYGILQRNFKLAVNKIDIRLLYSKYPLPGGLVVVNYYQKLFREALKLRNHIVYNELAIAQKGFEHILPLLKPETLNANGLKSMFYERYLLPQLNMVLTPLHHLSEIEHAYFCRQMTFVYREQALNKCVINNEHGTCDADLWNLNVQQKRENGSLFMGLTLVAVDKSKEEQGFDMLTLEVPNLNDDFLPNFRKGDSVCVYSYEKNRMPDVREAILMKGSLTNISSNTIQVHLNDARNNLEIFALNKKNEIFYAVERVGGDLQTSAMIRGLHEFITAPHERKALIMGTSAPQTNTDLRLTRSYHASYDDILTGIKQALNYYLLIGPPGTGKTSMALRFMVEEELTNPQASVLLLSYTNRAVDEISEMLCDAQIPFLRLGNTYATDERFAPYFIDNALPENAKLNEFKEKIESARVIVATVSTLQNKTCLFALKRFSLAIVDEASQMIEASLVGLLAHHTATDSGQLAINKFVLVGDHKQLPAVVRQKEHISAVNEPLLQNIELLNCRESLFERLLRLARKRGYNNVIGTLRFQGRMHPEVANFASNMFYGSEQLDIVPLKHQLEASLKYEKLSLDALDDALKAHRVMFFPSQKNIVAGQSDKVNEQEAYMVATLLSRIYRQYGDAFDAQKTVGVIVPYRNQIAMISKEIEKLGIPALQNISIDTVERYQGSQREVIIYSFTVQHLYQLSFLSSQIIQENGVFIDRKLNVALTRARQQMLLVGNEKVLKHNAIFNRLITEIQHKEGQYVL